ncbi:DUF1080 domain-containing protein [Oryzomonas sagensis]|uniref:DUF1080 domain-containing protein n=1 Tax=Oryzomonas sagensis TaxID=2603857 RepID=A0ABQ6TQ42_9BACT|nr:family 16 glycoside hydrolase [Oryzomonas sagensis]KAB0670472.1 DUF1080 domain-containing protein [Oryzomonas sagensis]
MKRRAVCGSICIMVALTAGGSTCWAAEAATASQWTFDREQAGKLPAGATVFAGKWAVRGEPGAPSAPNALCQTGYSDYPALSLGDKVYGDVTIATQFKAISGSGDRAAGIIFRIRDKDNYYILRANALEDNVNIYTYAGGRRRSVREGSAKVPSGTWQELRVEVRGNRIRGFLNNKQVVEAIDDTFKAGKVGLWTKADSVTCFDNVRVNPAKPE